MHSLQMPLALSMDATMRHRALQSVTLQSVTLLQPHDRTSSTRWLLQDDSARSMGGAGDTVSAEVEQIYGALLHGPKKQAPTDGMRLPLRTPQGTKALSEAIHALLEGHVEHIHQAPHHLLPVSLLKSPLSNSWHLGS